MFYTVIRIAVIAACCTLAGLSTMHTLQAQRYQIPTLRKELRRRGGWMHPEILIAAGAALVNWYLPILLSMVIQKEQARETLCNYLVLALYAGASALLYLDRRRIPQKKEFGLTRRIARLIGMAFVLNVLAATLLQSISLSPFLLIAALDYAVLLAALIMRPIEDKINAGFYNAARKRLAAAKELICIGITGSYGKTETKLILKTLLAEKYRVLATPPSYSSAMGISRVVNEQLSSRHQVFIAEMGAQQKGEIREMARLVRPQYGVLTCVADAHIDSFGSIETIAQTKFELIQSLRSGGAAFFGSDGSYGDRLYGLCKTEKYRAALGGEVESYMRAENLEMGVKGSRFELICADGEHVWVQTRLLGDYTVRNIALAAAVAKKLGLSMEEIARGVEKLKPVRHHMQLLPDEINAIDDSGNTLPEAAAEALRVLAEFPGRRILVTAGLTEVEMNPVDKNYAFGTQIAGCADYVVLIGPEETRALMRGLMSTNFPKSSVRMVRDEEDAAALVRELAQAGDTVLYEGVYPDEEEYEE